MLDHLLEKLRNEFNCCGNLLDAEGVVVGFDLVRVDRILRERGKMLEKLMKFSHQNKRHVCDGVSVIAHPSLRFFIFNNFDELVRDLVEQGLGR